MTVSSLWGRLFPEAVILVTLGPEPGHKLRVSVNAVDPPRATPSAPPEREKQF